MANLLVITGNTALKAVWSEGLTLGKSFRYQGEKRLEYLLSLTEKEKPEVLTIASVDGVLSEEETILRNECSHLIIHCDSPLYHFNLRLIIAHVFYLVMNLLCLGGKQ